jgi:hypothetical protein
MKRLPFLAGSPGRASRPHSPLCIRNDSVSTKMRRRQNHLVIDPGSTSGRPLPKNARVSESPQPADPDVPPAKVKAVGYFICPERILNCFTLNG